MGHENEAHTTQAATAKARYRSGDLACGFCVASIGTADWDGREPHVHPHRHAPLVHSHPHYPDLHHRHGH